MKVKSSAVFVLIKDDFDGNIASFCRVLKLSYSTVWRVLNGHSAGNSKFIPALSNYCKGKGLPLVNYLEF